MCAQGITAQFMGCRLPFPQANLPGENPRTHLEIMIEGRGQARSSSEAHQLQKARDRDGWGVLHPYHSAGIQGPRHNPLAPGSWGSLGLLLHLNHKEAEVFPSSKSYFEKHIIFKGL